MRHVFARPRSVPVLRVRGDERDVARGDLVALVVRRDHAVTFGDDENLIGRVQVRLIHSAALEVHLGEAQIAALLADEDGVVGTFAPGFGHAYHPHAPILAQTGRR